MSQENMVEVSKKGKARIHPIIVYPYTQSKDYSDLKALYNNLVRPLSEDNKNYARPITVMNRQTYYNNARYKFDDKWNKKFESFITDYVRKYSDLLDSWSVDSCQMWLDGFGKAFDETTNGEDVYWIIPGDFNYSTSEGKEVISELRKLPDAVMNHEQDLCIGEIEVDINSSKQLIDTYGTYGLLYNWFPYEAQEIRKITSKPRSEFFAIRHSFLREVLRQRWYAYEQTIVILLHGIVGKKRIHTVELTNITDLPQGRDTLSVVV